MGLFEGQLWEVRPENQCGLLALRLHHSTTHHICIFILMTRLSYGKGQEITKQYKEICTFRDNGEMRNTRTGAMEALTCLPPLDLGVQVEASSATHRLWCLGCWSNVQTNRVHSSTLMLPQKSDPIFHMGIDVMRPAYRFELKYRVTMVTREKLTWWPKPPSAVKGWDQKARVNRGQSLWAIFRKKAQYLSRKICYSFRCQDMYFLLLCTWNSYRR